MTLQDLDFNFNFKIYWNTKQYVTDVGSKIVRPVLRRADSVKQIGNSVLASKYTAFAADTLDGALTVADKYVDKYLPADGLDEQGVDGEYFIFIQRAAYPSLCEESASLSRRLCSVCDYGVFGDGSDKGMCVCVFLERGKIDWNLAVINKKTKRRRFSTLLYLTDPLIL